MLTLQSGDRIHLVDRKARHYALTLKAGETFQLSGEKIAHDAIIGRPDGSIVTLARGRRMLAVRPTLGEYVLKMPRGAQVMTDDFSPVEFLDAVKNNNTETR